MPSVRSWFEVPIPAYFDNFDALNVGYFYIIHRHS
jgi:hypothetical protein